MTLDLYKSRGMIVREFLEHPQMISKWLHDSFASIIRFFQKLVSTSIYLIVSRAYYSFSMKKSQLYLYIWIKLLSDLIQTLVV